MSSTTTSHILHQQSCSCNCRSRLRSSAATKALRRKRRQHLMKKGLLLPRARRCQCGCDNTEVQIHPIHGDPQSFDPQMMMGMHMEDFDDADDGDVLRKLRSGGGGGEEMMKLEKEMWETFYDTGFWRSPSQREENEIPYEQQANKKTR
ncbi:unnamed protein product [Linum tenue]|uniref:Uncharacterized protein n=1 Tax=Linum tenue TaxID=586396 RepID=A0AAV0RLK3_9ROSI|nr:unnamed protein product [Linum tenue]